MNILMVGIQDVTSACIADRLAREGNHITWFTSQEKQDQKQSPRAKIYRHEYDVRFLLRILQMQDISAVVFHYGMSQEGAEPEERSEDRITALRCLLSAMEVYGRVSQLVYLSTVELNHRNTSTPQLAEIRFGESLVEYHGQSRDTSVVILRTGMVYGEGSLGDMGYIGQAAQAALSGKTIVNRCSPDSYVDAVHAGDVAMAVYRLLCSECSGTFHCLTGSPITLASLHETLGTLLNRPLKVKYSKLEKTLSPEDYLALSQPLRTETGWFPLALWDNERGRRTQQAIAQRALAEYKEPEQEEKEQFSLGRWLKKHEFVRGTVETLLIFALTLVLAQWTQGNKDMRYVDLRLLFVVLISIQYGLRLGILASFLAGVGYAYALWTSGVDITYLLYGVETWIPFIVYALCGAVIGYVVDLRADNMAEVEEQNRMLRDRYDFLKQLQKETVDIKQQLQQQLSASRESFGKVYQISERLNTLSPNQMLYQSVDVLSEVMGDCQVSIWMFSDTSRFARRKACTNGLLPILGSTMVMPDYPLITESFARENIFVNREMLPGYPDFAVPIYRDNRPIAFAALYQVAPERFSVYYQNLFKVVVGLIENNLVQAMFFAEQTTQRAYLPDTLLLNADAFREARELVYQEEEKGHISCLELKIRTGGLSLEKLSERLVTLIRVDDVAGVDEAGQPCVLLLNASQGDFEPIARRFASKGVEVSLC